MESRNKRKANRTQKVCILEKCIKLIRMSDFHNGVASVRTGPDLCENRHIFAVAVLH